MSLSVPEVVLLAVAGFVAGSINAVAGGGSLVSFPALVAVGYPSLTANVTNTVALLPGYVGGALGYRRELSVQSDRVRTLVPVALLGGVAGSVALLTTSPDAFEVVVPVLVLAASALLALQPRLQIWMRGREPQRERATPGDDAATRSRHPVGLYLSLFAASAYGAYFGGGLGVVILAVLGIFIEDGLQRLNALKSALTLFVNGVAAVAFVAFGPVAWWGVLVLAPAALVGGYLGASLARHLPPAVLRWAVVTFGVIVAVALFVT
jgi:uncharacterized membrane protein YfcA